MRILSSSLLVLTLACGGASTDSGPGPDETTGGGDDTTYAIRIDRPWAVGQRWREVTQAHEREQQQVQMGEGSDTAARDVRVDLEAEVEVVEVDEHARQAVLRYTVARAVANNGQSELELVPAGTVLVVRRGGEQAITREDGAAIGEIELKMLGIVLPDGPAEDHDAVYGTDQAQAVGARWPIDGGMAAEQLRKRNLLVDPANIQGEMHLANLVEEPVPALELQAQIVATGITFGGAPEGATIDRGEVVAARVVYLPLDPADHPRVQATEMEMEVDMTIADPESGETGTLQLRVAVSRTSSREPL